MSGRSRLRIRTRYNRMDIGHVFLYNIATIEKNGGKTKQNEKIMKKINQLSPALHFAFCILCTNKSNLPNVLLLSPVLLTFASTTDSCPCHVVNHPIYHPVLLPTNSVDQCRHHCFHHHHASGKDFQKI